MSAVNLIKIIILFGCLILIPTLDLEAHSEEGDGKFKPKSREIGFVDLAERRTRTKNSSRLAKVDRLNLQLQEEIKYDAHTVKFSDIESDKTVLEGLDFIFYQITPKQFYLISTLYGGKSLVRPKEGRNNYRLSDFMPPLIQALEDTVFVPGRENVLSINHGRSDVFDVQSPDTKVSSRIEHCSVCWSTSYEILRYRSFISGVSAPESFEVFNIGRYEMNKILNRFGTKRSETKSIHELNYPISETGDLIIFLSTMTLYREVSLYANGEVAETLGPRWEPVLSHTAIAIDDDIVFERPGGGSHHPYRFTSLKTAAAPYMPSGEFGGRDLILKVKHYKNGLPSVLESFGNLRHMLRCMTNVQENVSSFHFVCPKIRPQV